MNRLIILVSILLALFTSGCATYQGYADFRNKNRANLMKVEVGMSKSRVLEIFGSDKYYAMTNPYKSDLISNKGETIEVIYYYTDYIDYDSGKSLESGLTPIIFKDNKVIGWGRKMLDDSNFNQTITIKRG
jgi:hypothetical protein